jgi:heterodisulfide reductase subunit B
MKYLFYPGCSLHAAGRPYDESVRAVFGRLGIRMDELEGWNCCGATAYMSVDETSAMALAARNLALVEDAADGEEVSLVAPCSACYLVLSKAQRALREPSGIRGAIDDALHEAGLRFRDSGRVRVRHPLDVLVNDVGLVRIADEVSAPLGGLRVACYYGCQVVRPYATFDDQRRPRTMDDLLGVAGAEPVDWPLSTRCCGGTLPGTVEEAGQRLTYILLREAHRRGAGAVATCCPLCQFNLECYQDAVARRFGDDARVPVFYFTQLLGRAMGLDDAELGLQRMFVPLEVSAV